MLLTRVRSAGFAILGLLVASGPFLIAMSPELGGGGTQLAGAPLLTRANGIDGLLGGVPPWYCAQGLSEGAVASPNSLGNSLSLPRGSPVISGHAGHQHAPREALGWNQRRERLADNRATPWSVHGWWETFWLAFPLYVRLGPHAVLDHPLRQHLYEQVRAHPGVHFRRLMKALGVSRNTLDHHLRQLSKAGLVQDVYARGRRRFFAAESSPLPGIPTLTDRELQILDFLVKSPGSATDRIASALGLSGSCTAYHLRVLRIAGLVRTTRLGRSLLHSLW